MGKVGAEFGVVRGQNMLLTVSDSSVFLVFELYYSLTSSKKGYTYDIYTEKVE